MQAVRNQDVNGGAPLDAEEGSRQLLSAQELLAGSLLTYDVVVPTGILQPGAESSEPSRGRVRLRPLKVATLALISRAARDDSSLAPLLMIKESLVEPQLALEQIRQMHAGLVNFLVAAVNRISGLDPEHSAAQNAAATAIGESHLLLAWHFGWTPAQVAELTPGQVAVYLAGIERLQSSAAQRKPA